MPDANISRYAPFPLRRNADDRPVILYCHENRNDVSIHDYDSPWTFSACRTGVNELEPQTCHTLLRNTPFIHVERFY